MAGSVSDSVLAQRSTFTMSEAVSGAIHAERASLRNQARELAVLAQALAARNTDGREHETEGGSNWRRKI